MEERPPAPPKKKRSKVACKRCHTRRIKCDAASIGLPCTNCANVGHGGHCDFITSNKTRGEKGRFKSRAQPAPTLPASSTTPDSEEVITSPSVANEQTNNQWRQRPGQLGQQLTRRRGTESEAEQWSQLMSTDSIHSSNSGQFTYVGESWSLSYTVHLGSSGAKTNLQPFKLHLPTPDQAEEEPATIMDGKNQSLAQHIIEKLPPMEIQAALIDAYLSYSYPIYPIINPQEFTSAVASKKVSKLLLLSILFCGAIHVDVSVIHRAGYSSRLDCLGALYGQAKSFYHTDVEQDKIAIVQSAFLLHQRWSSPSATMDPWTWLGLAIRLAQTMGLHRTTAKSPIGASNRRLWKRLWWCLYCREKQMASALGRPAMIQDIDCDVEPLSMDDFEANQPPLSKLFVIEQCKLAVILGAATQYNFSPGLRDDLDATDKRAELLQQVYAWRDSLLPVLQYIPNDYSGQQSIFTLFLGILFYSMIVLFHRPRLGNTQPPFDSLDTSSTSAQLAFEAASMITKITEQIMNYHSLFQVPLFYTSSLFAAMTMQVMKGPSADHQLSLCMIALRTIETMYPSAGWIRKIFHRISDKRATNGPNRSSTATRQPSPQPQMQHQPPQPPMQNPQHQNHSMPGPSLGPQRISMDQYQPLNPQPNLQTHRPSNPNPMFPSYAAALHHNIIQTAAAEAQQQQQQQQQNSNSMFLPENGAGAMTLHTDEFDMSDSGVEWSGIEQWENGEMMMYLQHLMGGEVPFPGVPSVACGDMDGPGLY